MHQNLTFIRYPKLKNSHNGYNGLINVQDLVYILTHVYLKLLDNGIIGIITSKYGTVIKKRILFL